MINYTIQCWLKSFFITYNGKCTNSFTPKGCTLPELAQCLLDRLIWLYVSGSSGSLVSVVQWNDRAYGAECNSHFSSFAITRHSSAKVWRSYASEVTLRLTKIKFRPSSKTLLLNTSDTVSVAHSQNLLNGYNILQVCHRYDKKKPITEREPIYLPLSVLLIICLYNCNQLWRPLKKPKLSVHRF